MAAVREAEAVTMVEVRIEGTEQFVKRLKDGEREAPERLSAAIQKFGLLTEGNAKRFAPFDTGRLSMSIHYQRLDDFECSVSDGVHYGIFQEWGTSKMRAHPFMQPGMAMAAAQMSAQLQAITKGL